MAFRAGEVWLARWLDTSRARARSSTAQARPAPRRYVGAPSRDAACRLIVDRCRGQVAAVSRAIADAADDALSDARLVGE